MRDKIIGLGFTVLGASGLHRLAAPHLRGLGAILMFHHVRPPEARGFAPNGMLEITPAFLDAAIVRLRRLGYRIISLDAAMAELREDRARSDRPFAVLTFDDGYRDNLVHALPVLERHEAPFTLYLTTGFADRTARLWWVELEEAIRRSDRLVVEIDGMVLSMPCATCDEKAAAWKTVYWPLRSGREDRLLAVVDELARRHGVDGRGLVGALCLDWDEIETLSRHPLVTIGAHTLTHPRLGRLDDGDMRTELGAARSRIEERIGRAVVHLAYPVGDPSSAGQREFEAAKAFGYESAVTTRPGLIHAAHADHPMALPRLSVNGLWQDLRHFEVLLSGTAFALWNRGRKLNVA